MSEGDGLQGSEGPKERRPGANLVLVLTGLVLSILLHVGGVLTGGASTGRPRVSACALPRAQLLTNCSRGKDQTYRKSVGRIWLIGMHEGEQNEGNHKVVKMVMRNKSI